MTPPKIGVLVSGRGSNLQALIDAAHEDRLGAEIVVVSNRADAPGLEKAAVAGIETLIETLTVPPPPRPPRPPGV